MFKKYFSKENGRCLKEKKLNIGSYVIVLFLEKKKKTLTFRRAGVEPATYGYLRVLLSTVHRSAN